MEADGGVVVLGCRVEFAQTLVDERPAAPVLRVGRIETDGPPEVLDCLVELPQLVVDTSSGEIPSGVDRSRIAEAILVLSSP